MLSTTHTYPVAAPGHRWLLMVRIALMAAFVATTITTIITTR
jgi:hypothetical protein